MEHQYSLQKYAGPSSRHTCPACQGKRCFTLYIDENGNPIHETVGRCDHESSCGYHKTPKEYFAEHPSISRQPALDAGSPRARTPLQPSLKPFITKPLCTIPTNLMQRSIRTDIPSSFTTFLSTIFPQETVNSLINKYKLGTTKSRDVIYYQIDKNGKVRTGKIMKYNPTTGKRLKDSNTPGKVTWVHSLLKRQGQLPPTWELTQCLFGEHLIPQHPDTPIALVESEKTAIICSALLPQYLWLATGGKSQLNPERLSVLKGREVIAFPDIDAIETWKQKLTSFPHLNIKISDYITRHATAKDYESHIDLADLLLKCRQSELDSGSPRHSEPPLRHSGLDPESPLNILQYFSPQYHNEIQSLIEDLDLMPISISH